MEKTPIVLEVCVDSLASALAAEQGGAWRIELCTGMTDGGVTPSYGLIARVCSRLRIPVHVLVRPRPGDFFHTPEELEIMEQDILAARELGAAGVVFGVLRKDGSVDISAVARLLRGARPMSVTFHRAFDEAADPGKALLDLAGLGVERVLTTGGGPTAFLGRKGLSRLVGLASGKISVMAGGGIDYRTAARIVEESGVNELHAGRGVASRRRSGRGAFRSGIATVDPRKVASLLRAIGRADEDRR